MIRRWPHWWDWDLELSPHLAKRMLDRSFTEIDLRTMLERAKDCKPGAADGRWVVVTTHRRRTWEIVVEPDARSERLVVITAYPCWES